MSTPTEQQLRELFAADAAAAPPVVDLTAGTLLKVRHCYWVRAAGATALVAAVAAVGAVMAIGVPKRDTQPPPAAAWPHSAAQSGAGTSSAPTGEGPLRSATTASCVDIYSPAAVTGRSFAFDGTVTAIGPALSNLSGPPQPLAGPPLPLVGVTFRVSKWFHGGMGDTVTIDMDAPANVSSAPLPSYGIDTRLLVSGEPRWGGAPLDAAIAWSCGFTRYHDTQTAAEWAAATP
jgi:hypothetical protein